MNLNEYVDKYMKAVTTKQTEFYEYIIGSYLRSIEIPEGEIEKFIEKIKKDKLVSM